MDDFSEKLNRFYTIILFLVFGLPILIFSIPVDGFVFFYNLFTSPDEDEEDEILADNHISDQSLEIFQISCDECLKRHRRQTGEKTTKVKFNKLNKDMQLRLNILTQVRSLVYDHFNDDKFIMTKTGERILNQKYLAGIREFNLLKKLVANCQDSSGMVDTQLLKSLVD